MISAVHNLSALRLSIIGETKVFLRGLTTGATDVQLLGIVQRIRDKEQKLLRQEGAVLDPDMWRILHNRLLKRRVEFIETNN
jgi:hypothetical protein